MTDNRTPRTGRGLSRRRLLLGGAAAGLGAVGAVGVGQAVSQVRPRLDPAGSGLDGGIAAGGPVPFFGAHQAGIDTPPQAHATFLALDLHASTDRDALRRMLLVLSDDAARLTQGIPALADSEPELGMVPARLTITFGFGPELVSRAAGKTALPPWLGPLPTFSIDRLEPAWSNGDLLLQIGADDPITVAHAARMLLKDIRSFATLRWKQTGFRRARGSEPAGTTTRNLFGQVDGTVNPTPGTEDFDGIVWAGDGWLAGGSSIVLRRISMDLDKWDRLDRSGRERSTGRTLSNGAPLTGSKERDEPDFSAKNSLGFPMIPDFAHIRRARSPQPSQRIHRRGYNYDDLPTGTGISNSGLIFASYQADVATQFVPIQARLDELDLLNEWTTPIGSAVFAIPPGCGPTGFIGDTLLE